MSQTKTPVDISYGKTIEERQELLLKLDIQEEVLEVQLIRSSRTVFTGELRNKVIHHGS